MNPLKLISKIGDKHVQWTAPLPLPIYDTDEVTKLIELEIESGNERGQVTDKSNNIFKFKCLSNDELPFFMRDDF